MLTPESFVVSGRVLVDYIETAVLTLTVSHVGPVSVPLPVLREFNIGPDVCEDLGIEVTDPPMQQMASALSPARTVTFEEGLCQIVAGSSGRTVLGSDRHLKAHCEKNGVRFCCVRELMDRLVVLGRMPKREAQLIVRTMDRRRVTRPSDSSGRRPPLIHRGGGRGLKMPAFEK